MSALHPILAVVRPSGAGTPMVRDAFEHVFRRQDITVARVEGESFHRFSRLDMIDEIARATGQGNNNFSHFGPEANLFNDLQELFRSYGETGCGKKRNYLHSGDDVARYGDPDLKPGEFTPWEDLPSGADMLMYEGLHGCVATGDVDLAPLVDLKIGIVPVINLEWIQKIHRDTRQRGYSEEAVIDTILRRMHDYVHFLIPQFERTDINFQTVPVVDTSDPFVAMDVPTLDECVVVIRFKDPEKYDIDFPYLMSEIHGSWMSRRNSIVIEGGKLGLAMELIMTMTLCPLIRASKRKS